MNPLILTISKSNSVLKKFIIVFFTSITLAVYLNCNSPINKNGNFTFGQKEESQSDTLLKTQNAADTLVNQINILNNAILKLEEIEKQIEILDSKNVLNTNRKIELEGLAKKTQNKDQEKPVKKDSSNNIIGDSIKIAENKHDSIKTLIEQPISADSIKKELVKINKEEQQNKTSLNNLTRSKDLYKVKIQKLQSEITKIINKNSGHLSFNFNFKSAKYSGFILNTNSPQHELNFHLKSSNGKNYETISNLYTKINSDSNEVLMITNGGMYQQNLSPQGLYIEKGETLKKLEISKVNNNTNFYMFPNGVFSLDTHHHPEILVTDTFLKNFKEKEIKYATQSGPMLVINDTIHPKFTKGSKNTNIRSGVGIPLDSNSNVLFLISDSEVNFYDFASAFKDLFSCKNALYLDGAISQMYLKEQNKSTSSSIPYGPLISITKTKK